MVIWCVVLMLLGFWGLLQDILALETPGFLNPISNVTIMLVALGLLIRIRGKMAGGRIESLEARIETLERNLAERTSTP